MKKVFLFGICTLLCSCASRNLHHFFYEVGTTSPSPEKDLTSKIGLRQALVLFGRKTIIHAVAKKDSSYYASLTTYAKSKSTDEGFYHCYIGSAHKLTGLSWGFAPRLTSLIYLDSKYRVKYILWRKPKRNRRILRSVSPEMMEQLRLENKLDSTVLRLR